MPYYSPRSRSPLASGADLKSSQNPRAARSHRLNVPVHALADALEARRLLALSSFDPEGHSIDVQGTFGNDTITVQYNEQFATVEVRINGVTDLYPRRGVQQINVDAMDGDDKVAILWAIPSAVLGRGGN